MQEQTTIITTTVAYNYWKTDMCKFESLQKDESGAKHAYSSQACCQAGACFIIVPSKWWHLVSFCTAFSGKPLPNNFRSLISNLCVCPVSSAPTVCIFSTYALVLSNIKSELGVEKAEKLVNIYWFYRAEEDNQQNLPKNWCFFCIDI